MIWNNQVYFFHIFIIRIYIKINCINIIKCRIGP